MRFVVAILANEKWRLPLLIITGVAFGMFLLAVHISNGASYLNNEAKTCLNCHVMSNAYATWEHGSHARVAVCNDCHVPHANPIAKVGFKAMDGARHSYVFTTNGQPSPPIESGGGASCSRQLRPLSHAANWDDSIGRFF